MIDRIRALMEMSDTLLTMHVQGQLPGDEYKKGLLAVAHDLMELGEREDAVSMIGRLDDDYVDKVLPSQMQVDVGFMVVATRLGKLLRGTADPVDVEVEQTLLTHSKVQGKPC